MAAVSGTRALTKAKVAEGLAFARRWRIANKPYFDSIYGPEEGASFCSKCGRALQAAS